MFDLTSNTVMHMNMKQAPSARISLTCIYVTAGYKGTSLNSVNVAKISLKQYIFSLSVDLSNYMPGFRKFMHSAYKLSDSTIIPNIPNTG